MLDLDRIRNDPDALRRMLAVRFMDPLDTDSLLHQDALRRELAASSKAKKAQRNHMSQQIGELKRTGIYGEEVSVLMSEMRTLGSEIAAMDVDIAELEDKIDAFLLAAPNYPHATVPVGKSALDNTEVYHFGERHTMPFGAKPYWNIGSRLRILDFDDTTGIGSAQPTAYRGLGARLERAVIAFLLDALVQAGCRELMTPYLVHNDENTGSSNAREQGGSVVSLYRERLLDGKDLPIRHCVYPASLRAETVSGHDGAGLSKRGDVRIELLTLCKPENSYTELSAMTELSRRVLERLGLPGRVTLQCTGQMPLCSTKTYDLEVWLPGSGRYESVAACSNCEAYLARQLDIRFRDADEAEPQLCHTLLGSGFAVDRIVAAILENHQNKDGSVTVPEALRSPMNTDCIR